MTGDVIDLIGALAQFAVGCVFIQAAVTKMLEPDRARIAVASLGIPRASSTVNALSILEGILGVVLCAGWWPGIAVPVAVVVLVGFSGVSLVLRLRTGGADCGCGVDLPLRIPPEARNLMLMLLLLGSLAWRPSDARGSGLRGQYYRPALAGMSVLLIGAFAATSRTRWSQALARAGEEGDVGP